jgi:hypothetical protein
MKYNVGKNRKPKMKFTGIPMNTTTKKLIKKMAANNLGYLFSKVAPSLLTKTLSSLRVTPFILFIKKITPKEKGMKETMPTSGLKFCIKKVDIYEQATIITENIRVQKLSCVKNLFGILTRVICFVIGMILPFSSNKRQEFFRKDRIIRVIIKPRSAI